MAVGVGDKHGSLWSRTIIPRGKLPRPRHPGPATPPPENSATLRVKRRGVVALNRSGPSESWETFRKPRWGFLGWSPGTRIYKKLPWKWGSDDTTRAPKSLEMTG